MYQHIMFDLDGTLLPMVQDEFVAYYMPRLAARFVKYGIEPKTLIGVIWKGVEAMYQNDGAKTNAEVFWDTFEKATGVKRELVEDETLDFYDHEFNDAIASCSPNPLAREVVKAFKARGCNVYLATNPIFPAIATKNRIRWAGLDYEDFDCVTTYENCRYSKPNVGYFQDVIDECGIDKEDCLMIGNDVMEDLAIRKIGVPTFLLTDTMENKKNLPIETEYQGSMEELLAFAKEGK